MLPSPRHKAVRLPCSSVRAQKAYAHLKLLSEVHASAFSAGRGHHRREVLWVLWIYDRPRDQWIQLASAQSVNWEWTVALREPAIRALHPKPDFIDVLDRGRTVAGEIMSVIDRSVEHEIAGVRSNILNAVYDQVAGRLASLS